jgi:hypothetical protein
MFNILVRLNSVAIPSEPKLVTDSSPCCHIRRESKTGDRVLECLGDEAMEFVESAEAHYSVLQYSIFGYAALRRIS